MKARAVLSLYNLLLFFVYQVFSFGVEEMESDGLVHLLRMSCFNYNRITIGIKGCKIWLYNNGYGSILIVYFPYFYLKIAFAIIQHSIKLK